MTALFACFDKMYLFVSNALFKEVVFLPLLAREDIQSPSVVWNINTLVLSADRCVTMHAKRCVMSLVGGPNTAISYSLTMAVLLLCCFFMLHWIVISAIQAF